MTNLTQQPVVVEQCDRDAAAALAEWLIDAQREWENMPIWFSANFPGKVLRGDWDDHEFVQSHVRHRLAERERCAKVAEQEALEAERFAENLNHPSTIHTEQGRADSARNIRDAIRSGKEPAA